MLGYAYYYFVIDEWSHFYSVTLAQEIVLLGAAYVLLARGADLRTNSFGMVAIVSAAAYSRSGVGLLQNGFDAWPLSFIDNLAVDALFPYYFWGFARSFPQAFISRRIARFISSMQTVALATAACLAIVQFEFFYIGATEMLSAFHRERATLYPALVYGMSLPVVPLLWHKMKSANEQERRRVRVFITGIVVSLVPPLIFILITSLAVVIYPNETAGLASNAVVRTVVIPMLQSFVIATPIITTYSILVERVLPVRLLLKQAIRYSLGRSITYVLISLPALLFFYYAYVVRDESLSAVIFSLHGFFLLIALSLSLYLFSKREKAFDYLDQLLHRSRYDGGALLSHLAHQIKSSKTPENINSAVDKILADSVSPQSAYLLVVEEENVLLDPLHRLAPQRMKADCWSSVIEGEEILAVTDTGANFSLKEEKWLAAANARVLIPLHVNSKMVGLLVLGDKKSELPYSSADFKFLSLVASLIATFVSSRLAQHLLARDLVLSYECPQCRSITVDNKNCACGYKHEPVAFSLPKILHGRYELYQTLGGGQMGVVVLARDIHLDRKVVLKSVDSADKTELEFLRKEAQLMAGFSHQNIATLYGYESFQGVPILVCEFLSGGTLSDVLNNETLSESETIKLGVKIAGALHYLHSQGVVHGDVKPSNIGINSQDDPKLLDFGLADLVSKRTSTEHAAPSFAGGSLAYMSPEGILGLQRDPQFDIWALCVTLFESFHGLNPFVGDTEAETKERILNPCDSLEKTGFKNIELFSTMLHTNASMRPKSGQELIELLETNSFKATG